MKKLVLLLSVAVVVGAAVALGSVGYARVTGLTTRAQAGYIEEYVARGLRRVAIPADARTLPNPLSPTSDVMDEARAHFADHCASCHANDGSGQTELGQGLYPKAPDMRRQTTQGLSDGELFYVIEEGIRFTGMPGWGTGTPEGARASWALVHFIRRLPTLTADDLAAMAARNPRSPEEIRLELEEERFLNGGR